MPALIKHIRGTRSEWVKENPIIPDGVLALSMENGSYNIVVGDGKKHFADLRGIRPKITDSIDDCIISITVNNNDDIRLSEAEELYITLPTNPAKDFSAMVTFFCGEFGTMFSYPSDCKIFFSGTDVIDREFHPAMYNHYTLFFWYDGYMQCNVRAVYQDYDN